MIMMRDQETPLSETFPVWSNTVDAMLLTTWQRYNMETEMCWRLLPRLIQMRYSIRILLKDQMEDFDLRSRLIFFFFLWMLSSAGHSSRFNKCVTAVWRYTLLSYATYYHKWNTDYHYSQMYMHINSCTHLKSHACTHIHTFMFTYNISACVCMHTDAQINLYLCTRVYSKGVAIEGTRDSRAPSAEIILWPPR